ncbi:SOS response-associated peptidase [Rhizobium sp. S95]|uniref:Abasic site processing protein n=1 Tax=Ciceribacter sichuanensis TaxID=2949647 RepID=A0AAJ1F678_9HYPH|nr:MULTISPECIES: SOS response-associated peptidase [unclassified Ciceribacter]MCM2395367.1 SOS response-associated peptidase [Ciceribacter sp. S95]MCM2400271.1 SOS response-associated peptidase [Ciceribacter sp. S153]MCO5955789.1 SOS response-associated peptidase [Ciceribacter sp. S101]
MCGRFSLTATPDEVRETFGLVELEGFPARYNIAPTQPILVVVSSDRREPGSNLPERQAVLVRWGFLPGWVKDPRDFPLLINARSETAIGKASFRAAMRHRRVLVPASGFYEWHRPSKESGEASQAYWIRPRHGRIVAFAGLMEIWSSADGSEVDTGAILTVSANRTIGRIHDRMPVVIKPEDYTRWLDCKSGEPRDVADLMVPAEEDFFEAVPVSNLVNKVANTGPEIQEPVGNSLPPAKAPVGKANGGQLSLF